VTSVRSVIAVEREPNDFRAFADDASAGCERCDIVKDIRGSESNCEQDSRKM